MALIKLLGSEQTTQPCGPHLRPLSDGFVTECLGTQRHGQHQHRVFSSPADEAGEGNGESGHLAGEAWAPGHRVALTKSPMLPSALCLMTCPPLDPSEGDWSSASPPLTLRTGQEAPL